MSPRLVAPLVLLLLMSCSGGAKKDEKAGSKTDDAPVLVRVEKPELGTLAARLEITSRVIALETAEVLPRVEGLVMEVLVDEGSDVARGDVLARLEDDQLRNALEKAVVGLEQAVLSESVAKLSREEAAARLNAAEFTLTRRKSDRDRALNQFEKKALSEQDRDKAEYDYTTALSEREQAAIQLRQAEEEIARAGLTVKEATIAQQKAELELSYTFLKAPIAGRVMRRHLRVGQKAIAGQTAFVVADLSSLVIEPKLPEKDLRLLREDLPVYVESTSFPGETRVGRISAIAPEVAIDGGSIKVRIALKAGTPPLRPGMFVSGHIETEKRQDAVLLNKKALLFDRERAYVFVAEKRDGKEEKPELRARKVYFRRGLQDAERVEYLPMEGKEAEIDAESEIVVVGLDKLSDGALLEIEGQKPKAESENPADESGSITGGEDAETKAQPNEVDTATETQPADEAKETKAKAAEKDSQADPKSKDEDA